MEAATKERLKELGKSIGYEMLTVIGKHLTEFGTKKIFIDLNKKP